MIVGREVRDELVDLRLEFDGLVKYKIVILRVKQIRSRLFASKLGESK